VVRKTPRDRTRKFREESPEEVVNKERYQKETSCKEEENLPLLRSFKMLVKPH
jgi:hypothetical protein